MNRFSEQDERAWDADKREFVADHRDVLAAKRDTDADARDSVADERDQVANERERDLYERERRVDASATRFDVPPERAQEERDAAEASRAQAAVRREDDGVERERARSGRTDAESEREQAGKQSNGAASATGLAMAFAEIAAHLFDADSFGAVFTRIGETAVEVVAGCAMASTTLREPDGQLRTSAWTHETALAVDRTQYEANEGPCLDAIDEPFVYAASLPDSRWPTLGAGPLDVGVRAMASYRLTRCESTTDRVRGSLNTYGVVPEAFDDEAVEIGLILAAHASVAIHAFSERDAVHERGRELFKGLESRDVIGQAKGILMERLRLTPDEAFDVLRRSSQHLNVKLREVAQRLADTGELDEPS